MAVNLICTVDVDNDGVEGDERTDLRWTSVGRIPYVKTLFAAFDLRLTWFVRADNQLHDVYGTAAYLLKEHAALWAQMERAGDEIGWHPHLYEWHEETRKYIADWDEGRCARKLEAIRRELTAQGFNHTSVRIGEAFHGNALMRTLDELGLAVDSTAIPGRTRSDQSRRFDWGPTPNEPYHPSAADYRVPDAARSLSILEVPMTTMPVKASYDPDFMTRYINPGYHHANFKAGIERLFADKRAQAGETFLTLILHSDEIGDGERAHALYSFSLAEVRRNIAYLLAQLEAWGLEYRALRLQDVAGVWAAAQAGQENGGH